jgi:hypothetical protein
VTITQLRLPADRPSTHGYCSAGGPGWLRSLR